MGTMKNEEIDEAIEVNAMNFKSPPTLKKLMALIFGLVSKKLSFLWSAGAEMSHEGWVQNAHKDRLIYQRRATPASTTSLDVLLVLSQLPGRPPRTRQVYPPIRSDQIFSI